MYDIVSIFFFVLLPVIIVWQYYRYQENKRRRKEFEAEVEIQREIARQKLNEFLRTHFNSIISANNEFTNFLEIKTGYFSNYQLVSWKQQYTALFDEIKLENIDFNNFTSEQAKSINTFIEYFRNSDNLRNNFNKQFVNEELKVYHSYFDNVEGRKLDIQQRTAIITEEDNNIIIAGAGSGKTTTIVGKVGYVMNRYNVKPENILLISFTNKSATTLAERINVPGLVAKTFHKFGKDIITEAEGRQPSIFDEVQFIPLLTKYFNELISNPDYLKKISDYFANFLKLEKSQFEFDNQGDYIQYIMDQNFKSYKLKKFEYNGKITYKMEVVKSIEECKIANFLLFNGVNYEYEFPYEHETATIDHRQYKPDFTIKQNDKIIYLEHFGISRNGDVPGWFTGDDNRSASKKYSDDMEWKRNVHTTNGTTLIESYSYEMSENILFENLTRNLQNAGIILEEKSPEEIWNIIAEAAKDEVTSFINLIRTFITLMKSNNYTINDVVNKNKQTRKEFIKKRNDLFIEIIEPIFERYEKYLSERNEIDFSDMINKATKHIEIGKYKRKISHLIIDEFQDISIGRYRLLKAIKTVNPACKLFCVGDDWQSIYRFSGSDIALFKDFEDYFGVSVKSKIETTYRFHNPLISLSSEFILKNPNQVKKDLKGISNSKKTDYKIIYSASENQDDTLAIQKIFHELSLLYEKIEEKEILILGRYSFDFDRIKNENAVFRMDKLTETISCSIKTIGGEIRKIKAQYLTVHKSKGLEGDIVIVLNCNAGRLGFPSEISDDQVLNLLLSEADQFENSEERRLFYVAMTRAREKVYFITESSNKSKFIKELEVESGQLSNQKCPKCKTADVVLKKSGKAKNGRSYRFYGCTNYIYGCDFKRVEWLNNS